jgi:putative ABC transport system permease protein
MARSFLALRSVEPGFDPEQVLAITMRFNLPAGMNPFDQMAQRRREILERLAALPGVVDVAAVNTLPLQAGVWEPWEFTRPGASDTADGGTLRADGSYVSAAYLRTMGIPLVRGEPLPDQWPEGAPVPFLVSETAARRFWPGQDPVGRVVRAVRGGGEFVVRGVVGDVRQRRLAEQRQAVYFPQALGPRIVTTFVIRSSTDPLTLVGPSRQAIQALDPNQPIRAIATMKGIMSESIARDRFFTILYGVFGMLALGLAAVGVYGVLAYSVSQRTQEIGVRMALGARGGDVLRMVVGGGMRLVLIGVALGGLSSLWLTRVLTSQLYGVTATDPVAFIMALAVLMLVALLACYVPARRATLIDPIAALRDG